MKQVNFVATLTALALILSTDISFALNDSACSTMLNNGFYKKYEFAGIDQPMTKATKKHGTTKATVVTSTEGSTAFLDPKYWSNVSTSGSQGTSSWGACSLIGLQRTLQIRENYFAVNKSEVLKDISKAEGEHLQALANLSMCDDNQVAQFNVEMQKNLPLFINTPNGKFNDAIDKVVSENPDLNKNCFNGKI